MKRIFTSIFVILIGITSSVSAQSSATRQTFEKGINLANEGKFEKALANFKQSQTFAEDEQTNANYRAKIHFNIGVCLYRLKQNAESIGEFEAAIKLSNGDYEKAFYALGMAQAELKNWREAEKAFHTAIRLNETNGEIWFDLAFVYLARKDYDSARTAFEKSVEYKSVASNIGHNNLGVIFALNGDLNAAVKEFEIALKKSNGKFAVAERNLQFCKSLGQNYGQNLTAKLEFGK